MNTVFHRDVVAELAQAAKGRIPAIWYYNCAGAEDGVHIPKEFQTTYDRMVKADSYDAFRKANIYHLITNMDKYSKVAGIWWDDGGKFGDTPVNAGFIEGLRQSQPWLIMNPRCGVKGHVPDWRGREQKIGDFSMDPPWEMCIPMESSVWFYAGGKEANTKDFAHCLQLLIMCATRDGNLLLNISPMPDGRIQPLQEGILREMGVWLGKQGQSIYGTRGGPYLPGPWGGSTRRRNRIYLDILQELQNGELTLPPLPAKVVGSSLLTGGSVTVKQSDAKLTVLLDEPARAAAVDRVVELEMDREAMAIGLIATHESPSLTAGAKATASSEHEYARPSGKNVRDAAANVLPAASGKAAGKGAAQTERPDSAYWTSSRDDANPWLVVDMGRQREFQQVSLIEMHTRIRRFVVERYEESKGAWDAVCEGGRMNHYSARLPTPVSARKVRLRILETRGGPPQVVSFNLYP